MASNMCKVLYLVLWMMLDMAITTMLYPQQFEHYSAVFLSNILHHSMAHSMFDLWVCSLVRTAIILGALCGFLRNTTDGVQRTHKVRIPVLLLAVVMGDYPIVKLLIYSENTSDMRQPFFWAIFAWSLFATVIFICNWMLLGSFKSLRTRNVIINSTQSETESLLGNGSANSSRNSGKKDEQDEDEKKPFKVSNIVRLMSYSRPDWPLLMLAFVFLLLSSLADIFTPWYTGQVIEGIAITKNKSKFIHAIIIMSLFSAGSAFAAGVRGGCFSICISRLNMRLRNSLFSSLIKQEIGFYDVTQTGEITSRLTADTQIMSDTLALNVNVLLRSLVTATGVCVFMFRLSWQLSMVTVIGLPLSLVVSKVYGSYLQKLVKLIQECQAKANEVADEVLSSMRTVRSFAGEVAETKRYSDKLLETYKVQKRQAAAYAGYMWCSELFSLSLVVATLYYGGHLVINDRVSGGQLVSFILYQMQLGYQFDSISYVYSGLMQAAGASEKVFEFISREPVIPNDGGLQPTQLKGQLEFNNVSFAYPSRPETQVLKNVTFGISPGEVVALVGPSGGGKSSCVALLEHFYETSTGHVFLDGIPIQQYDHKYIHQKIALVGQEPVLYARSIKENIAYGMEDWDMATIQQAAKMANAHQFIMEMNDKYETQTGEKGIQLSGGQKQRVAIARAMIRNPVILLLDEATSALDSESEHLVQEAIYKNLKGRTVMIIAHRLSTVERADRIIVINKGSVVEQGTHKQLLKNCGLYAKLVQRQLLGTELGISNSKNKLGSMSAVLENPTSLELKQQTPPRVVVSSPSKNYGSFKSVTESPIIGMVRRHPSFQNDNSVNFEIGSPHSVGSLAEDYLQ